MKHCALLAALFFSSGLLSLAAQSPQELAQLLSSVDRNASFTDTDLAAEYLIETRAPGGALSAVRATMFRRDRSDQFLILILEPAVDKGKGYLKIGDTLWLYDPVGKSFVFTSARERFQNSSVRNSDFSRSTLSRDYRPVGGRREKLGRFDCTVIDLEALGDGQAFPRMKIWVSDDALIRKREDYSLSGQLMRTTAIPTYQQVDSRWVPASMVILDHLRSKTVGGKTEYERTTVTVAKPSLKGLPDTVYTKEYLERVAR